MSVWMSASYPPVIYVKDTPLNAADQMFVGPSDELVAYLTPYGDTGEAIADCMSDTFNIRAGAAATGGPYAW